MNEEPKLENDHTIHINRILARLYFNRDLNGEDWLSERNRDSIRRTVHYGDQYFIIQSPLTLGGLIDKTPSYTTDACARVLATGKTITREEFLVSFLELLLTEDQSEMLGLLVAIEQLDTTDRKKFRETIESYLVSRQIPAEDLYTAFGVYVLQKAHDQGTISMTNRDMVVYNENLPI